MKSRYYLSGCLIICFLAILTAAVPLMAELYEPLQKAQLAPLSEERFQQMIQHRAQYLSQLQKSESLAANNKFLLYQSYTEPTPNMLEYDVSHYEINIGLDFANHYIDGYSKTTLTALVDNLSTIDLNLGYIFNVSHVLMNDAINVYFAQNEWFLLTCYLPEDLDSGQQISLTVYYSGYPDQVGYMQFYNEAGSDVCYTSVEPFGARFWWPCKDFPFDKPDSVDVIVTHPAAYTLVSNGLQRSRVDNGNGTATTHWHEGYPIATYLVTIGCTDYVKQVQSWEYASGQFMPVEQYYYPGIPPDQPWSSSYFFMQYTIPVLDALSYWFTLYPFVEEKYGHNHYGWGGAMEHQTVTSIWPFFNSEWVIAHECAHQWGGDLVTCENFHHIWLNEGFATYAEVLYVRYYYGENFAKQYLSYLKHTNGGSPYVEDLENDNIFDGITVYDKAGWLFYMLHMILGDDGFRTALDNYFHDPELEYASALTEDLQRVCEGVYGGQLDWFFDRWVYQDGSPYYRYSYLTEPNKDEGVLVNLAIEQIQDYDLFIMPIELQAFMGGTDTTITVFNSFASQVYQFVLPEEPDSILLDPNEKVLCEKEYDPDFGMYILGQELPEAYVGTPYHVDFEAIGGLPPYTWTKIFGQTPYGLTLYLGDSAVLDGIPTYASAYTFILRVTDESDPAQSAEYEYVITVNPALPICGDVNGDEAVNIGDAVYLINYVFVGGPEPSLPEIANVNCDNKINLVDIIYLINYVFKGGPEPCAECPLAL